MVLFFMSFTGLAELKCVLHDMVITNGILSINTVTVYWQQHLRSTRPFSILGGFLIKVAILELQCSESGYSHNGYF